MRVIPVLLFCTLAIQAEDLGTLLSQARAARDAGQLAVAISTYEAILAQVPDHETALYERAQTLSWAARYTEALEGYRTFSARFPQRVRDADLGMAQTLAWRGDHTQALAILAPWAQQGHRQAVLDEATYLAWSGHLSQSIAHLDTWLQAHPDDLRAALDKARFQSWTGRLNKARQAYQAILAREPSAEEARMGLVRMALWKGAPETAEHHWQQLGPEARSSPEGNVLKAQIEAAVGKNADARRRLETLPKGGPAAQDAHALLMSQRETFGPWVEVTQTRTVTSEKLRSLENGFRMRLPLFQGSFSVGAGRFHVLNPDQHEHATRIRTELAQPLGPRLSLGASLDWYSNFGGKPATAHSVDLGFRVAPGLDIRATWSRSLFLYTPQAFSKRGSITAREGGVAWTFWNGRNTVDVGFGRAFTSAGSSRNSFSVSYQHRLTTRAGTFKVGYLFRRFGYSTSLPLGFFNPTEYQWKGWTFGYGYQIGRQFSLNLDGRSGRQIVNEGDREATWAYTASIRLNPKEGPWIWSVAWSDMRAGLPVTASSDPHHYGEQTLTFGLRYRPSRRR